MEQIGFNDGITGFVNFMRKIPLVRYREKGDRPESLYQWFWLEKVERTLEALVLFHDINAPSTPEGPPIPLPPVPIPQIPPRAYNVGDRNQDPVFCMDAKYGTVWDNIIQRFRGKDGSLYYMDGKLDMGRDRALIVPELTHAGDMNFRSPCEPYVGPTGIWIGGEHGYPEGSFK